MFTPHFYLAAASRHSGSGSLLKGPLLSEVHVGHTGISPPPTPRPRDCSKQIHTALFFVLRILLSDIVWSLCSLVWYPSSLLQWGLPQSNLLTLWPLLHHCNSARSLCLSICATQAQERVSEQKNGEQVSRCYLCTRCLSC